MTLMQTRNERRVEGTKIFVASTPGEEHIAHLRVGEDWDAIGDEWLTVDQLQDLIALLVDARKRHRRHQQAHRPRHVHVVWRDRHLPPFNVPPTYPALRAEEV